MGDEWKIIWKGKQPSYSSVIFIEGLPGIGNVGKIAVDFLADELKAKQIATFFSYSMPHSVFVNDKNLVELPKIELHHAVFKKQNFIFMIGDIQPADERSCYSFCDTTLDLLQKWKCKEIVTTGGIGLQQPPEHPKIYCTGNQKKIIQEYKKYYPLDEKLYGVVGPIIGVSGVFLGLAEQRNIPAISLLAETFGHPMYIGMPGAQEMVKALCARFSFKVKIQKLDLEAKAIDKEVSKATKMDEVSKQIAARKLKDKIGEDVSYIG